MVKVVSCGLVVGTLTLMFPEGAGRFMVEVLPCFWLRTWG